MHPHGVRYGAADEGAAHGEHAHGGNRVAPGERYTYTWLASADAGPGPGEPSSKVWLYHSHVEAEDEIYRGLLGTIVIVDPARARPDGRPADVGRELTLLFLVFDENGALAAGESPSEDERGPPQAAINGRIFANLEGLTMAPGERVRWYLAALGTEVDLHSVHWHGATVTSRGQRTDVVELLPASMTVADMVPHSAGRWMVHCHIGDHITAGMTATYQVE
jgi:FtsP/CotA-like multicopper oxidase with cupredoxin domain